EDLSPRIRAPHAMGSQTDVNETEQLAEPPSRRTDRSGRRSLALALALVVSLASAAAAQDPQDPGAQPQQPGVDVAVDGDRITVSVNESTGVPIKEFIKLAQKITGRTITFGEDLQQTQNIS